MMPVIHAWNALRVLPGRFRAALRRWLEISPASMADAERDRAYIAAAVATRRAGDFVSVSAVRQGRRP